MKHAWEIDWSRVDLSRGSDELAAELKTSTVIVEMAKMPRYLRRTVARHPEHYEPWFFSGRKEAERNPKAKLVRKSLLDV